LGAGPSLGGCAPEVTSATASASKKNDFAWEAPLRTNSLFGNESTPAWFWGEKPQRIGNRGPGRLSSCLSQKWVLGRRLELLKDCGGGTCQALEE
jgi:hypothetical protein